MERISVKSNVISEINNNFVKETLFEHGPVSKPEISKITKLSLPTVNKIMDILCAEGYARIHSIGQSSGGRKPNFYVVNEESGYICIVFIQGMKIISQLCSITGVTVSSESHVFESFEGVDVPETIVDLVNRAISGYEKECLKIIGIGIPGIASEDGTITGVPTIPQLDGVDLKSKIEGVFKIPVYVENDVNMSAVGISFANKDYANIVYAYIGKGIGMGIVLDGKLYKGAGFLAGEVGKMVTDKYVKNKNMLTSEVLEMFNTFFPDGTGFSRERVNEIFTNPGKLKGSTNRIAHLSTLLIINAFCFLDPNMVFLDGDLMCEPLLNSIKEGLIDYLGDSYADKVIFEHNPGIGVYGAKKYCMALVNKSPIFMRA